MDVNFRDETNLVAVKAGHCQYSGASHSAGPSRQSGPHLTWLSENPALALSPSLLDRGTAFFIHQYVFQVDQEDGGLIRGNHEYLPGLLRRSHRGGALDPVIAAAGLAALSNVENSIQLRSEAYRLYGSAIRKMRTLLEDPILVKLDETLAGIMLMGTFEVGLIILNFRPILLQYRLVTNMSSYVLQIIASADAASMQSFSMHVIAAARCIELRGPEQFRNEASVKLFVQLRRLIVRVLSLIMIS